MADFILDYYTEQDFYSDGDIENVLLDMVEHQKSISEMENASYPIVYHLSNVRENILNWYPFDSNGCLLEIGSGCGAITGMLCSKVKQVVSVELSKRRATINYKRNQNVDNLSIYVGNLNDMEFGQKFDYIVLNGVFEYAMSFTNTDNPYVDFLSNITRFLSENGKVIIAIENKYGLKYFAGAPEDHTNEYFLGVNDYEGNHSVRTFGKKQLCEILNEAGLEYTKFYYPYPDYKFPNEIFTDESFVENEYGRDYYNLNGERFLLFNESKAARGLAKEGIMAELANSFLVIASKKQIIEQEQVTYVKINNDRSEQFRIMTKISELDGKKVVTKLPLTIKAAKHINQMIHNSTRKAGVMQCVPSETSETEFRYDYLDNKTLNSVIMNYIKEGNREAVMGTLDAFFGVAFANAEESYYHTAEFQNVFGPSGEDKKELCITQANIDLICDNVFYINDVYYIIDCEWIFDFPVPVGFIKWRIINELYNKGSQLSMLISKEEMLRSFDVDLEWVSVYGDWNYYFCKIYVGSDSLENYSISKDLLSIDNLRNNINDWNIVNSYLYIDYGNGYNETDKVQSMLRIQDGTFQVTFQLPNDRKINRLRWDPMENRLIRMKIVDIDADGKIFPKSKNSYLAEDGFDEFLTFDPQYEFGVEDEPISKLTIKGSLEYINDAILQGKLNTFRQNRIQSQNHVIRRPIDIIIPIYNAFEDLNKCIDSLKQYTDLTYDRLILINDCSTDERMLPYLQSIQEKNIIFINNESNAGFSNNVNKGMQYSEDRDVILLNSDTIVTSGWVDKIITCAYSKPEIGTVTPMSNSATLCSYPIMCMDNKIPEHLTIDELGAIVERASMHVYPRITVAVGFCMFIKRQVIREVGLFDAQTFERGYGEENDFCNRAEQFGYIHVMCDDTFIYHKGTVSFVSEEKKKLIEAHDKILVERYPAQMERNHQYCMKNPDKYIRDNIDIYAKADPKKKNLMYVVHSDFRKDALDNVGGTQFHVRDLVYHLKDQYNVYVAARDREFLRVTLYNGNETVSLKYFIGEKDSIPREKDSRLYNLFTNLYKAFQIDVLHVHHTHGLSFDMIYAAHDLNIPIILTMHDYYYICPNVKLVNGDGVHCDGYRSMDKCEACLKKNMGIATGNPCLMKWRPLCRHMLELCDRIIIPSEAAKNLVNLYHPGLDKKMTVIEHGMELAETKIELSNEEIQVFDKVHVSWDAILEDSQNPYTVRGWAYIEGVDSNDVIPYLEITVGDDVCYFECTKTARLDVMNHFQDERYFFSGFSYNVFDEKFFDKDIQMRLIMKLGNFYYTDGNVMKHHVPIAVSEDGWNIAFIGGMVPEKGSQKAAEMIMSLKKGVNWHVFGTVTDPVLVNLQQDNLYKHGTYSQQDLPKLMKEYNIDLICILPIWPETFCYTISEAITCDIPVFVTDIGAVGERVKRNGYGWTVPVDMSGVKMAKELNRILKDKEEYSYKKQIATTFTEISLQDMSDAYGELYEEYIRELTLCNDFDRKLIFEGLETPLPQEAWKLSKITNYDLVDHLNNELRQVNNTLDATNIALNNANAELNRIRSNLAFRVGRKLKHILKPGK